MKGRSSTGMALRDAPVDAAIMDRCLRLARRGGRAVEPNPLVGCIIVRDGRVVGQGWHKKYGGPHAEVFALRDAGDAARGADVYVTLEPCNHHGKTPPCTDALIAAGVGRVIIGMKDPNPSVRGGGIAALEAAGIPCITGLNESATRRLNERFIVNTTLGRPLILLKIAQTLDGFIAPLRGSSQWISSEASRTRVHAMRAASDAILVGAGTVRADNPALTVRDIHGANPRRIIVTRTMHLPLGAAVFSDTDAHRTIVATTPSALRAAPRVAASLAGRGITILPVSPGRGFKDFLPSMLTVLFEKGVNTLMVEGGAGVFSSFLKQDLADRLDIFVGSMFLGAGLASAAQLPARDLPAALRMRVDEIHRSGGDVHLVLRPHSRD